MNVAGLADWTDLEVVDRRGDTLVLRGLDADSRPVLVKTHASALPTAAARERLRREHAATAAAQHPNLVGAVTIVDQPNRAALVLEDPQGPTVADALGAGQLDLAGLLLAAVDVAAALAALHARGIAHRAIDAEHVVLTDGGAVVIDLYDACPTGTPPRRASHGQHRAPEDLAAVPPPASATGDQVSLAAMVRHSIDVLGIAEPDGLRRVLDQAAHADPRLRYRSVLGLGDDLRTLAEQLGTGGATATFPLSTDGLALDWEDPRDLVGRDGLLEQLDAVVDAIADDGIPQVVVIRGPHGSGRSSLLGAMCDRLADRGVISGLGHFDDSGSAVPLRGPAEVMDQMVAQLLGTPDETLQRVRDALSSCVGLDLPIAAQIVPSLTHLVGEQPAPPPSPPEEAVARVERTMQLVVRAISSTVPPLVAVLDDADRADNTSLRAIELISGNPEAGPQLTVLAVASERSRVDQVLDRLRGRGVRVRELALAPLGREDVRHLVAQGTGSAPEHVAPVADAVWSRSGGNPQVALAELWTMVANEDLGVDLAARRWVWTPAALAHDEPSTVDAVARTRLAGLPDDVLDLVAAVAVAGRAATTSMLAAMAGTSREDAEAVVARGVAAHVLARPADRPDAVACLDDGIRRAALDLAAERPDPSTGAGPSARDRLEREVVAAVLATVPVDADGEPAPNDAERYKLVRLLTGRSWMLDDPQLRHRYVAFCEDAARSAHRSGGFQEALDLQRAALDALGEDGWTDDHDRTFELHLRAAEHALMVGEGALPDQLLDAAWAHDPSALQRVRAMRVLGTRAWISQDHGRGLAALCDILAELGEPVPARPTWKDVGRELVAARAALGRTEPEWFLGAPPMEDECRVAALDAMLGCVHLAYVDQPILHVLLVLRGTRLTVEHGVTPSSSYFLTAYGMLQLSVPFGMGRGLRFGAVGHEIARRSGGPVSTMVVFAHNSFVRHWGVPLDDTVEPMLEEYGLALANRQRGYGLTGGTFALLHSLLASRPLRTVEALASSCRDELGALGEAAFCQRVDVILQAVHDLRDGYDGEPLDGARFSAPDWLAAKPRRSELAVIVHTLRALVALSHGDRDAARQAVHAASPLVRSAPGQAVLGVHWFQLAYLDAEAFATAATTSARARRRATAERSYRRLRGIATHAPANAAHRVALVEAVLAEGQARPGSAAPRAMERYDAAVALATEHGALYDLGLIAERAARFHADRGRTSLARHYASLARDAWHAWGADGIADAVAARLPEIVFDDAALTASESNEQTRTASSSSGPAPRPAAEETFAEATRLLGQELEVREFLERLVEILMRHADATRGFLVLESTRGPVVEVAAHLSGDVVAVTPLPSPDLRDHDELCVPAVNYVLRSRQVLSLVEPADDRRLRADTGLRDRSPRALLCLPVGRPTAASGALVLESDTFTHAFESERVEALRVLSEQAISAIDHARLSSDLTSLADDVAELRSTAAILTAQAETDPLTGVANRLGLESKLRAAIREAHANAQGDRRVNLVADPQVGVLFCDLDGFKQVNDSHGHASGDLVLAEVARRIRAAVRADDVVARVGGDEFVVVSVGVSNHELHAMADRVLEAIAEPIEVEGTRASVSTSIGVGRADLGHVTTTDDVDALVDVADQAMYRAKHAGKNRVDHA